MTRGFVLMRNIADGLARRAAGCSGGDFQTLRWDFLEASIAGSIATLNEFLQRSLELRQHTRDFEVDVAGQPFICPENTPDASLLPLQNGSNIHFFAFHYSGKIVDYY